MFIHQEVVEYSATRHTSNSYINTHGSYDQRKRNMAAKNRGMKVWQKHHQLEDVWEQYCVSIDLKPRLTDAEKLVSFRQALKDREAKEVIEGLFGSGDDYKDAVE